MKSFESYEPMLKIVLDILSSAIGFSLLYYLLCDFVLTNAAAAVETLIFLEVFHSECPSVRERRRMNYTYLYWLFVSYSSSPLTQRRSSSPFPKAENNSV